MIHSSVCVGGGGPAMRRIFREVAGGVSGEVRESRSVPHTAQIPNKQEHLAVLRRFHIPGTYKRIFASCMSHTVAQLPH